MENQFITNEITNGTLSSYILNNNNIICLYCGGSRLLEADSNNSDYDVCVIKKNGPESGYPRLNIFNNGVNAHLTDNIFVDMFGDANKCNKVYQQFFVALCKEDDIVWKNSFFSENINAMLSVFSQMRRYTTANFLNAITDEERLHFTQNAKEQLSYKKSYLYWIASVFMLNNRYELTDNEKLLAKKIKISRNSFIQEDMILTEEEINNAANTVLQGIAAAKLVDNPQSHLNDIYLSQLLPILSLND